MPHLIVAGAGIVGLACARAARRRGWRVTLVDRDPTGDRASHGNAGGIGVSECLPLSLSDMGLKPLKWLLDPLGPLSIRPGHALRLWPWYRALRKVADPDRYNGIGDALAALNQRALADLEAMLADIGLSGALHKLGALTVYETDRAFVQEQQNWQFKRDRGVRWRTVDRDELRALEPRLAPVFRHAVLLEDWAHVDDPKQIVDALRERLQADGVRVVTGEAVKLLAGDASTVAVQLGNGQTLTADKLLVACGAWSARLARSLGDHALLESERGYNTTLPDCTDCLQREVIFAEAMFVATPLAVGLRIGGAAEFAGLDAPADYRRSDALMALARRYLNGLDERRAQRWMGQRPSTPDTLPVIGTSPQNPRVLYAFGHGHLGLTQAATTAELIGGLLDEQAAAIDLAPYAITRFGSARPEP